MRKFISLLFLGLLVSGCYQSSLTYVAPATGGIANGKAAQSFATTSASYLIKEKTMKQPIKKALPTPKGWLLASTPTRDFCLFFI